MSTNFCPDTFTNPVELGGGTAVVVVGVLGLVVGTVVGVVVGTLEVPGRHWE